MMRLLLLLVVLWAMPAHALIQADEVLPDAAQEARAVDLGAQLRCMTCPMQSLNDSDAPMARDMRKLVREQVVAGVPDDGILAYLRQRYGDDILLHPPVARHTWLLWALPFAALAGGLGAVFLLARRRGKP